MKFEPSKKIFVITLIISIISIPLILLCAFRVGGQYSYTEYPLSGSVKIVKAGTYSICYEALDAPLSPPGVLTFTFTDDKNGVEFQSHTIKPYKYDRYFGEGLAFATIAIETPGTFKVTVNGTTTGLLGDVLKNIVLRTKPASFSSSVVMLVMSCVLLLSGVVVPTIIYSVQRGKYIRSSMSLSFNQREAVHTTHTAVPIAQPGTKRRWIALLLASIPHTGILGIDRFYLGYMGMGFIKFFTCGGLLILWIVDIVRIAKGTMYDAKGRPLI